ncbi:ParA family protein [Pseudomonas cichorii]|uniref:ParA family protein n=1 Tax=Pseudomonas cichorii TaxID=36746 RepID=UPI0018E602EA|nr:ParA family protein [Pseudomonas cichorii]MBI6854654.1 ParA family protein [Pseudomonas cichorii]
MKVVAVANTKGGAGKTTVCANLGAISADAGLRTLLIDLDPIQPSLSSYFTLAYEAPGGIYELIATNETRPERVISRTVIPNLSVILSNDENNQLINLLLQAPDGRLRLAQLIKAFKDQFDLVLIDTQGARSVVLEMCMLAADLAVSPLPPNMLAAREFHRGTVQMLEGLRSYALLGLPVPPVRVVVNMLDNTTDAREIHQAIRESFENNEYIQIIKNVIPALTIFHVSSTKGIAAHRLEYRQPSNRVAPSALEIVRSLAIELFPEWKEHFDVLTEEAVAKISAGGR